MWIDLNDNAVYARHDELRLARQDRSMPEMLTDEIIAENGFRPVVPTPRPETTFAQKVVEVAPVNIGGAWRQTWAVVSATTEEEAAAQAADREVKKTNRAKAVERITVTVNGKIFDGDEVSQGRMVRALLAMQIASVAETTWVLANNMPTSVTVAELGEALVKAGLAQNAVWVIE